MVAFLYFLAVKYCKFITVPFSFLYLYSAPFHQYTLVNIYFINITFFYSRLIGPSRSKNYFHLLYINHHQTSFKPSFKLHFTANPFKLSFPNFAFYIVIIWIFPNHSIVSFSPIVSFSCSESQHRVIHRAKNN